LSRRLPPPGPSSGPQTRAPRGRKALLTRSQAFGIPLHFKTSEYHRQSFPNPFKELQERFHPLQPASKRFQKFPKISGPRRPGGMAGRSGHGLVGASRPCSIAIAAAALRAPRAKGRSGVARGLQCACNPLICLDRARNECPDVSKPKGCVGRCGRRRGWLGSSFPDCRVASGGAATAPRGSRLSKRAR